MTWRSEPDSFALQRRNDLPEWEVTDDGKVIGWVQQFRLYASTRTFYRAISIDPAGVRVNPENHTIDDRVAVIAAFHENPESFRGIHWHARTARQR